ncbi:MAG: sporulation protein YabP [Pelosinus sp.]|nr:sporulation protein YabP [Pelosinus sp.]
MPEDKTPGWRHKIALVDREDLTIDGVVNLGSYDEKEILMETEYGNLTVHGQELNIKSLNLEKGNISIDGVISGIMYEEPSKKKKGLLGRLLR